MSNKIDHTTISDDKVFTFCIETELFKKKLEDYMTTSNKCDKNLAEILKSTCELIADFTKSSEVLSSPIKNDAILKNTLAALENNYIKIDANLRCVPCKKQFKYDPANLAEHVSLKKHQVSCEEHRIFNAKQKSTPSSSSSVSPAPVIQNNIKKQNKPTQFHLNETTSRIMLLCNLDHYTNSLVYSQLVHFNNNKLIYESVASHIIQTLRPHYPNAIAYIFGSNYLKIANKGSDLDLYVDIGNTYYKKLPRERIIEIIKIAEKCFVDSQQFRCVTPVKAARTPILKVLENRNNIRCDLSFGNGLSCYNSSLLLYFMELQPITRKLIAFIRYWTETAEISVNGYSVALIVVFFLQVSSLLPSVEFLQRHAKELIFDEWNAGFVTLDLNQLKIQPVHHFHFALKNFFHFYGCLFDYNNHIVCPFLGRPIRKTEFDLENIEKLPKEFARFKAYMSSIDLSKADKIYDLFANDSAFVVQDPFELNHNVTKSFAESRTAKFRDCCRHSYEILKRIF